ncbi:MAG TPA: ribonuclease P protein component [Chthoniobacterales bacterium]|nr:ribonuclease P protein component [Chthoniobacterales bacterium]
MTKQKRLTLPKSRRLIHPAEFDRVKKHGRVERGKFIVLGFLQADGTIRAGFVTSRAIGRAVVRNRVRRRLREIVRKHQNEIVLGTWAVTIARAAAASATYQELEGEWLRLAGRASILSA